MARSRKRSDYQAPARRERAPRPVAPGTPAAPEPAGYFPPGTWKKVLVGGVLGATGLAALAAATVLSNRGERDLQRSLTAGSCTTDTRTDPTEGDGHVADPTFTVDPPSGGDHLEQVARAGVYAGDDVPEDGRLVHALEHGYVVLWHRPGVDPAPLRRVFEGHDEDVIVAERASLPVPVAATAWERRLLCQQVEPAVLERFVDDRVGEGPEDVERG